jgi:hypothetical protein
MHIMSRGYAPPLPFPISLFLVPDLLISAKTWDQSQSRFVAGPFERRGPRDEKIGRHERRLAISVLPYDRQRPRQDLVNGQNEHFAHS